MTALSTSISSPEEDEGSFSGKTKMCSAEGDSVFQKMNL